MLQLFLEKLPLVLAILGTVGSVILFLAFKHISYKVDDDLKKEVKERLRALEEERMKHVKKYSVHREIERRKAVDIPPDGKE